MKTFIEIMSRKLFSTRFSSLFSIHGFIRTYSIKKPVVYYKSDPSEFLSNFPPKKMTITAYRVTKDYVHYVHSEIIDSTKRIRILNTKTFSRNEEIKSSDLLPTNFVDPLQTHKISTPIDSNDDGDGKKLKKSKNYYSKSEDISFNYTHAARIVDESPTSDAYVLERIMHVGRIQGRKVDEIIMQILNYVGILRAQLTMKARKRMKKDKEEKNSEAIPPTNQFDEEEMESVFESNGKYVQKLFNIRKSDIVCESFVDVVKNLSENNFIDYDDQLTKIDIAPEIMEHLNRGKKRWDEIELEKHLLCGAILENVAFSKYLLDLRSEKF